ncbi:MAG TPA: TrkH family potassium uptake protein [Actinobacteria bacterium]|nr:TrkH family potassium uptake protein [Actinomycetota bacterium]
MIRRPRLYDWQIVGLYTGKIVVGVGLLMIIPLITGIIFREWSAVIDFTIGMLAALTVGFGFQFVCQTDREMNWMHGLVTTAFSWLVVTTVGAGPHYLSGHFNSFLDAMFDLMSGFTTTGLYLLQDLDHISNALNMWRHIISYAGGQGIIVIALTFLIRGTSGAFMMYVGEGKDEKLLPNVIQTARAIWVVSLTYLVIGTTILTAVNYIDGLGPVRSVLHGMWLFMSSWSTGGFAPQSMNVLFYHSTTIELVTMVIFIIGSFNFALHWAVWNGDRREIYRNVEIVSFSITLFLTVSLAIFALMQTEVLSGIMPLFRKGFYQVISGHTGTGLTTLNGGQMVRQWGPLAMLAITIAMTIGGSVASTCGGIKGMRMGIIAKSFIAEIRHFVMPESTVAFERIHHLKTRVIEDKQVRSAMMVVLAFVVMHLGGAMLGVLYDYSFVQALFESVSAGTTTGLSVGITNPSMPILLKVYYILAMWAGRLEFMAVFALVGFFAAVAKGR